MRTVIAKEEHGSKRIDKVLREVFTHMPPSAMHKAFRKKDIKVNGLRIKDDYIVVPGDKIEVYIVDDILDGVPVKDTATLNTGFSIIYEDHNLLVVNKEQGVAVHPDREETDYTLINLVQNYLREKGEYDSGNPASFPPSLCHRLDRNTGGLMLIAKNSESLKLLLEKIKDKEIKKYYQCLVKGKMERRSQELKAYLEKDERKSRVFIHDAPSKNSLEIITRYQVISYDSPLDISRLEVELVTGRTHQIRAHLAYIGHPIIGDGKYGTNTVNRALKAKQQALWAYKLVFDFRGNSGILEYLKGRKFEVQPEFKVKPSESGSSPK